MNLVVAFALFTNNNNALVLMFVVRRYNSVKALINIDCGLMVHFNWGKNMEYSWSCSGNKSKLGLLRMFKEVELEILSRDLSIFFDELMNVHCGW